MRCFDIHRRALAPVAFGAIALLAGLQIPAAHAAVAAAEAEQLKSTLTPFGAEKAGNKEGTIPAWTGGLTTATPGFKNGGKRPDPFASEKPLYSVTAKNMDTYADKLSDGQKAMLKKYPDTYRIDVYPTHRTAAAPQWVYDATFKNATSAKLVEGANGQYPEGASAGLPFPIPKTGLEVLWNHQLRWRAPAQKIDGQGYMVTADGRKVLVIDGSGEQIMPYYKKDTAGSPFKGDYWLFRTQSSGPPIRAGEGIVVRYNLAGDDGSWVYLTGQRRVRKLPNACCDTPNPSTAGVMAFDDVEVFMGRSDRYDWKLVGKKELLIPYNSNRSITVKADDFLGPKHLNPDHVRWELHRVWVVEAKLKDGQRNQVARGVYYFDEDTGSGVLADRWDAKGTLWKTVWMLPIVEPDVPVTVGLPFGMYDLLAGTYFANGLVNDKAEQVRMLNPWPSESGFTPEGLIGASVR